jgi:hypothetical protein
LSFEKHSTPAGPRALLGKIAQRSNADMVHVESVGESPVIAVDNLDNTVNVDLLLAVD